MQLIHFRRPRRVFAAALALILLISAVPASVAAASTAPDESVPVRVGLYYGDTAAPSFNLQNVTGYGSGYRLGYFDGNHNFVQLGYTGEVKISVLKTHNIYLANDGTYTTDFTHNGTVGCFHVQLPAIYGDFESAKVMADIYGGFVAWINGSYYVRIGSYAARAEAQAAAAAMGGTFAETSSYGLSVTVTGTNKILFQFDDGGSGTGLGIKPGLDDYTQTQTWCKGNTYFGSFRYQRIDGEDITLVNMVPMNDYINCVISREMSDSWPIEALKAQAVCARTYYATQLNRHGAYGVDVCSTTHCQAYTGTSRIGANTARAAAETAGQYLWYNGELVEAYYYSSNGGTSEACENVWNDALPYLRGIVDPYEIYVEDIIPNYRWSYTFTGAQLQEKLVSSGRNCGVITSVSLTSTAMGNANSITFHDANGGSWTISRNACRSVLGLPSLRFGLEDGPGIPGKTEGKGLVSVNGNETLDFGNGMAVVDGYGNVTVVENIPYVLTANGTEVLTGVSLEDTCGTTVTSTGSTFTFKGSGSGHNVGMSQYGARAMANQGLDYRAILTFYYTGTNLG